MTSKSAAAWRRFITPALLLVLSVWAFVYGAVTGCGVAGGIVAAVLLPAEVNIAGWIVVAASVLVGGLRYYSLSIAKKQALDRLGSAT